MTDLIGRILNRLDRPLRFSLATRLLSEDLVTCSARSGAESAVLHDLGEGEEIVEIMH